MFLEPVRRTYNDSYCSNPFLRICSFPDHLSRATNLPLIMRLQVTMCVALTCLVRINNFLSIASGAYKID